MSTPHLTLDPNPSPLPSPETNDQGGDWSEPRDSYRDALAADVGAEIDRLGVGDAAPGVATDAPASGEMDREKFREFFFGVFQLSRVGVSMATQTRALETLNVSAKTPGAPQAADEAYNLCLKVPAFRPLLKVADNPVMSALIVSIFVGGVGYGSWQELKPQIDARRAAQNAAKAARAATVDQVTRDETAS